MWRGILLKGFPYREEMEKWLQWPKWLKIFGLSVEGIAYTSLEHLWAFQRLSMEFTKELATFDGQRKSSKQMICNGEA
jgi:hypothetical protein